jgi:hypothetical protein
MNKFDKNQKAFPSFAHRSIWRNGLLLLPPEVYPENMKTDKKEINLDLYRYKADMYADMYQNPASYFIDTESIQEAMNGRAWYKAHKSAWWNKQKEKLNKLEEIERTNLPEVICLQLFVYLTNSDNEYFMSKADFDKYFITQSLKKCKYKINESDFLSVLSGCGLSVTHKNDMVYFSNDKYPLMFAAIAEWQKLLEPYRKGKDKYKYDSAFSHLDYRFFFAEHKLMFENSKWYMSDEVLAYLSDIHAIIARQGKTFTKLDNTLNIAIGFRLKNQGHLLFEHFRTYPSLHLKLFHSDSAEYRNFEERINHLPNADEIKAYCIKWIRRCARCPCQPARPASAFGNRKIIFGREMRLCGPYLNLLTTDFSEKSLTIVKTILEVSQMPVSK